MTTKFVADKLWEGLEPLLPEKPPKPKGGRPRIDERAALTGILFVLKSAIPWEMLPRGDGVRLWHDLLLATAQGMAPGGGGVGPAPREDGGCSTASAKPMRSTGRGRPWTRRALPPSGG